MWDILSWLFFFIFIAALIVVGGLLMRGYLTGNAGGTGLGGGFFGPKPEKRLDVVEQANVDGRRRLLLIRRDDVEHLIMTGGPVDVLIETGIMQTHRDMPQATRRVDQVAPVAPATTNTAPVSPPVFARQPRALGQAAGEG